MKKIVGVLVLTLLLASCGTKEKKESDVVKAQIEALMSDVESGMAPSSKISEITKFDSEAKPYSVGDKETGNFNSKKEEGDYKVSRFYTKKYNDDSILGAIRLSLFVKDEAYYNPDTDEEDPTKKIDGKKYVKLVSEKLGFEPKGFNGGHLWKTEKGDWYMNQWDDYSLEFRIK